MKFVFTIVGFAMGVCAICNLIGCSKKSSDTKSATINVPDIRPPVQDSLPAKLFNGGTFTVAFANSNVEPQIADYTKECQTSNATDECGSITDLSERMRCIIKQRLFCTGPTEVLNLLKVVDDRLAEIEARSTGTVPCMGITAVDSTGELTFPGSTNFTHSLLCKDSSNKVAWGKTADEKWYLRTGNGAAAGVYSIDASKNVEGYMWLHSADKSFSQSTGLLHIAANKTAGTVEITGGGGGLGFCSFHFVSNATNIYLIGNPDGGAYSCDYNNDGSVTAADWKEVCINASDLSAATALSDCDSLKALKSFPTLGRAQVTSSTSQVWGETAANPVSVTLREFDMGDFLNTLHDNAGTFSSSVEEFTVQ